MYDKCITCSVIGVTCNGPNFSVITAQEVLDWCKRRAKFLGWSQEKLAIAAGMPKGTVSSLFAGKQLDFKHDTVRPMVRALIGGSFDDNPCHDTPADIEAKCNAIKDEYEKLLDEAKAKESDFREDTKFWRSQLRVKNIAISVLSALLFVALGVIIAALIVDRLNSDIGFFWLS